MKRKVFLIPFIIFAAIAAVLLWQLMRNAEGDDPRLLESALVGKPVPVFRLESLENPGQHYESNVLIQGKPILLNVWATWCPALLVALNINTSISLLPKVYAWWG